MSADAEGPVAGQDRVYAVGYRPLETHQSRWTPWPIARTALVLAWRRRATRFALGFCALVFFGHAFYLVGQMVALELSSNFGQGGGMANAMIKQAIGVSSEVLSNFLHTQFFGSALALAVIGGGLVAEDRRAGALELYFARPVSTAHYAQGKLLAALLVPAATLIAPFLVLWLMSVGIAPDGDRAALWWLVLPGLAGGLLASATLASLIVGLSALADRGRTVGVVFILGLLVLAAVAEGLASTGQDWAGYLSPQRNVSTLADAITGVGFRSLGARAVRPHDVGINESVIGSVLGLLVFIGLGLSALAARLRSQEA